MNFILNTDSYKLTHHSMYPHEVQKVYSYLEAREGDGIQNVLWFGLQAILKEYFEGVVVTREMIDEAEAFAKCHFSDQNQFNRKGWERIVNVHGGRLPIEICALPEGYAVPRGTPLMTVENTDPKLPWLTNAVESLLMHVWYPTTVASLSFDLRTFFNKYVKDGAPQFMLHDFGYRGVSSNESARMGGMAHLLSFLGTDTLVGMQAAREYYGVSLEGLAYSVAATEHSIMTQYDQAGEETLIRQLMATHPNQILSMVADSYDYYQFVKKVVKNLDVAKKYGTKVVIRPDSPTPQHPNAYQVIQWTLDNTPDEINVLWGDGLTADEIKAVVHSVKPEQLKRLIFGMGGGLLQKVNRDTLRFALKCSDVTLEDGSHKDIRKNPLDQTKASKAGRFNLPLVFKDGIITSSTTFDTIRQRVSSGF